MESSNHHKQQAMGSHLLLPAPQEKRRREQPETAVRCPRCNSGDTKFCYYNNYSLSQPRHFCKTCRRYWTKGGSLRNIPVGGSSRKNRRKHSPSSSSSSKKPRLHRPPPPSTGELGGFAGGGAFFVGVPSSSSDPLETPTFLDILRNRFLDSSSAGGFGDLCDGFHGGAAAPPLEGFVAGDGGEGPFVGLQSPQLGGGGGSGTAEPFGRDYWDGFGSTRHGRPVNTYFV